LHNAAEVQVEAASTEAAVEDFTAEAADSTVEVVAADLA